MELPTWETATPPAAFPVHAPRMARAVLKYVRIGITQTCPLPRPRQSGGSLSPPPMGIPWLSILE